MGCASSKPAMPGKGDIRKFMENLPTPIAFEVPLHEDESVIRKHPPKKFQLEGCATPPILTQEMLQEKLEEAERRRLRILRDRIESAKNLMKTKSVDNAMSESNMIGAKG